MLNNKIISVAFSLIELMIVIAIIGILASIAVPSYESYIGKAKITEGFNILDQLKQKVLDFYNQTASMPASLNDLNVNSNAYTTSNISSVSVGSAGAISVVFTSNVIGTGSAALTLTPTPPTIISGGSGFSGGTSSIMTWTCTATSDIPQNYLPSVCNPAP